MHERSEKRERVAISDSEPKNPPCVVDTLSRRIAQRMFKQTYRNRNFGLLHRCLLRRCLLRLNDHKWLSR
jgi:hypothetical protein